MSKEQRPRQSATPTDPAAARKAARRKRRIRRRIIRIAIVLTALLLVALLIALVVLRISGGIAKDKGEAASLLAVKAIEVEGDTRYTDEEIIAASGIYVGESLLVINKVEAHNAVLARFPYLDTVDVGNASFSTIRIQVRETPVMGVVETATGYLVVGENNRALELITDEATLPAGAVRIQEATLLEETVGKPLLNERSLRVTATLLSAARQYGLADVTGIQLGQKTNIRLMWKNQIEVVLGNESNLALQIKALVGILPTLLNNNGEGATGRLDMRSYADGDAANDRAIFSPMTLEELQGTNEVPSDVTTPNESVDGTGETGKTDGTTEAETSAATAGTTLPAAA